MYLMGGYRRKMFKLVILFLTLSLLDLAGIGLIVPYVSLITDPDMFFSNSFVNDYLVDESTAMQNKDKFIVYVGIGLVTIFAFKTFFSIWINKKILQFCFFRGAELRSLLMRNYQSLDYKDFVQGNSSDYVYAIQNLTMIYSKGTLYSFLRFLSESIVTIAIICMLIVVDIRALMIFLFSIVILYFIYSYFYMDKIGAFGKRTNIYGTKIIKYINEGIGGLKEIRVLGKEHFFRNKVDTLSQKYAEISVENRIIQTIPRYSIELIIITLIVMSVMVAVFNGEKIETLIPVLSMFGLAAIRLTPSINQIIASVTQIKHSENALILLYNDVKKFDSGLKKESKDTLKRNANDKNKNIGRNFKLELKGVGYKYDKSNVFAIENINILVKNGDCVGIVGKSGSGKSTIVDIMLGLLKPSIGSVELNGDNLEENIYEFQSKVAYLPQDSFVIDSSLRDNITLEEDLKKINYEKLNDSIIKSDLEATLKSRHLDFDSRLGEGGVLLSGGQRQRVSLARAFYHDKDFLIFDESTSALDEESELEIYKEIMKLKGEKTIIIISHRKSALKFCDYIYDLNANVQK